MGMEEAFAPMPPEGKEGENQQPAAGAGQEQHLPEGGGDPGGAGGGEQGAGPPTAGAEAGARHVPLEVLETVRGERNDWKGKATEAQTEARLLRERLDRYERPATGQPPAEEDPVQRQVYRMENVVLNSSERAARRDHGTELVDKAWARVQDEFKQNPALYHQIVRAPDPWDQVVQHGKRLMAMDEIGNDPAAFRKKVEEEVKAQLAAASGGATPQSGTQAATRLPESLAGARSAGARGTTWTGPAPFDTLFPN